jgi:DNA polymerase-3 subunit delta
MPDKLTVQHAFGLLESPPTATLSHIIAVIGEDPFLKRLVLNHLLSGSADEAIRTQFSGEQCTWAEIADELVTLSLFGPGPRRVLIQDADDLVSRYREQLEEYANHANCRGTLILDLSSLPANTRLYRAVTEHGLLIDCRPPGLSGGRSTAIDVNRMRKWLAGWGQQQHGIRMTREALELLPELVGWEFGRLDQELAKLALFVERGGCVGADLVQQVVGGWRTQTTWQMLDAAADGDAASALTQLDRLLMSGEAPQALFGSIAWSLRRFAAATRQVERQEQVGCRGELHSALQQAGFRPWPAGALDRAEKQLRQISRQRGGQLYRWLLETDLALKGTHASPARGRWALEFLFLRLAHK